MEYLNSMSSSPPLQFFFSFSTLTNFVFPWQFQGIWFCVIEIDIFLFSELRVMEVEGPRSKGMGRAGSLMWWEQDSEHRQKMCCYWWSGLPVTTHVLNGLTALPKVVKKGSMELGLCHYSSVTSNDNLTWYYLIVILWSLLRWTTFSSSFFKMYTEWFFILVSWRYWVPSSSCSVNVNSESIIHFCKHKLDHECRCLNVEYISYFSFIASAFLSHVHT